FNREVEAKATRNDSQLEETVKNAAFTDEDLLRALYVTDEIRVGKNLLKIKVADTDNTNLIGMKVEFDHKVKGEPVVRAGKKVTHSAFEAIHKAKIEDIEIDTQQLEGAYAIADVVNTDSGE